MAGVKETLEVFAAVDTACEALVKAAFDGKLGIMDLRYAIEPVKAVGDAVKGAASVAEEVKDLDIDEAKVLLERAIETVQKVVAAATAVYAVVNKG